MTCSETFPEADQEERKQLINLLFPQNLRINLPDQQKLQTALRQFFNLNEHRQYLINYTFKNHNSSLASVYCQFLIEKYPELQEPKISLFYENQFFPNPQVLGQFRENPSAYNKRHVAPLEQATFVQLDDLFIEFGFIPNLERFLMFFPRFLQKMRIVQKQLFQNSQIDQQTTYFFGLCAAAQMGCPYMINRMAIKYLSKGGKNQWIEKEKYSHKIAAVLPLNRKLARCVWQISTEDFEDIIEQGFWNINQLALIIQIISFIHFQCVMTLGLGLIPQQRNSLISTQGIQEYLKAYRESKIQSTQKTKKQPLKEVVSTLKVIIQEMKNPSLTSIQPKINPKRSFRKQRISNGEEQQNYIIEPYMKQIGIELTQQTLVIRVLNFMNEFLPKYNPIEKRRDNKCNMFACVDFNFQFMAFPRLQSFSFVNQSTKKILGLIKQFQQMGFQNFGSQMIGSTKEFRKAQRYYGQNLCGYTHPEYDYKKFMNNILPMPLKFYIRLLMLSPLHMRRQVLDQINHQTGEVELFDLGHTAILIAGAKLKLSLTLTTYYFDC